MFGIFKKDTPIGQGIEKVFARVYTLFVLPQESWLKLDERLQVFIDKAPDLVEFMSSDILKIINSYPGPGSSFSFFGLTYELEKVFDPFNISKILQTHLLQDVSGKQKFTIFNQRLISSMLLHPGVTGATLCMMCSTMKKVSTACLAQPLEKCSKMSPSLIKETMSLLDIFITSFAAALDDKKNIILKNETEKKTALENYEKLIVSLIKICLEKQNHPEVTAHSSNTAINFIRYILQHPSLRLSSATLYTLYRETIEDKTTQSHILTLIDCIVQREKLAQIEPKKTVLNLIKDWSQARLPPHIDSQISAYFGNIFKNESITLDMQTAGSLTKRSSYFIRNTSALEFVFSNVEPSSMQLLISIINSGFMPDREIPPSLLQTLHSISQRHTLSQGISVPLPATASNALPILPIRKI